MPTLSQTDLDWIRDWIGTSAKPTDDDLGDYFDTLGSREAVAWRVLSRRYTTLLATPASVGVSGAVTVSSVANISALKDLLDRLAPIAATAGVDVGGLFGKLNGHLRRRHGRPVQPSEYAEELGEVAGSTAYETAVLASQMRRGRWQGL